MPWRGGWVGVHTAGLERGDRTRLRRRERALQFLGLRALDAHLFVRPDNLKGGVDAVRAETRAGNVVAIGQGECVRVAPPPETILFHGPFEASLSSFSEESVPLPPTWAVSARAWYQNPGHAIEVSGSRRLSGPLWLEGAVRFDGQYAVGLRWEIR